MWILWKALTNRMKNKSISHQQRNRKYHNLYKNWNQQLIWYPLHAVVPAEQVTRSIHGTCCAKAEENETTTANLEIARLHKSAGYENKLKRCVWNWSFIFSYFRMLLEYSYWCHILIDVRMIDRIEVIKLNKTSSHLNKNYTNSLRPQFRIQYLRNKQTTNRWYTHGNLMKWL